MNGARQTGSSQPRDPARPFSRLPRVASGDAPGRRRRHRAARIPRHRPGHQGRGADRSDASGAAATVQAQGDAVDTTIRIHHYDTRRGRHARR